MHKILLEIGLEEVPAGFMPGILNELKENAQNELQAARIRFDHIKTMGTPRRITLVIDGVAPYQEALEEEVRGPSVQVAYADNKPTKALEGFMRGQKVTEEQITVKSTDSGEYVFALKREEGASVKEILPEHLKKLILNLHFPKYMRWGAWKMQYVRPIHWLVALMDDEIIPIQLEMVASDRYTRGHRFLGEEDVEIPSVDDYQQILRDQYVIVDVDERAQMIRAQINELEEAQACKIEDDDSLFEEINFLIEYPQALIGNFAETYLNLPDPLVVTPMKDHQRYFPLRNAEGKLLAKFLTVRNGNATHLDIVQKGNEKVLEARLADAKFFYEEDLKVPLDHNIDALKNIVFQEKLGTVYDKVQRVVKNVTLFGKALDLDASVIENAEIAAHLAKCDLVSNVVTEFPELQGIAGEEYVLKTTNHDATVAQAVREHYQPRFAQDDIPETLAGALVSLADKMDTIVGCFAAGVEPTGSQDPYALRRQALGIVRILVEKELSFSLENAINIAVGQIAPDLIDDQETFVKRILDFFSQRVSYYLSAKGYDARYILAIINAGYDDPYLTVRRAEAVQKTLSEIDQEPLLESWHRSANLAKKSKVQTIDESVLTDEHDQAFMTLLKELQAESDQFYYAGDYENALKVLDRGTKPLNKYFENVMIMVDDVAVRNARLFMLQEYVKLFDRLIDLSQI